MITCLEDHIEFMSGYEYQLKGTVRFQIDIFPERNISTRYITLTTEGLLTIYLGYCWDGPSGPTIDTKNFHRGALVHDALYQLLRGGHLPREKRADADRILMELCRHDKMSDFRSYYVYQSVRLCGSSSAKKPKKVFTAP
jgi:hypothetical protein